MSFPMLKNDNVEFGQARSYPEAEWQNKGKDLMQSQQNPTRVEMPILNKTMNQPK